MTSQEIVALIEAVLEQKNMSKTEFYEKCGVSRATFSQWRAGKNYPSKEALDRINVCLGLTLAVRMAPKMDKKSPPSSVGELTAAQREAVDMIRGMTDAECKKLIEIFRLMQK